MKRYIHIMNVDKQNMLMFLYKLNIIHLMMVDNPFRAGIMYEVSVDD